MFTYAICVLFLASACSAGVVQNYDSSSSMPVSVSSAAADNSYGTAVRTETRCTPYFETVQRDHCEAYSERTCMTAQKESCADVGDRNCRAVVSSKQVRKCFNVTEQRCNLKEDVTFDTIQVPVVVQKCHKVNERVCDTVYDTSVAPQEKSDCVDLENPVCSTAERTVHDRTCRTTTKFDCSTSYADNSFDAARTSSDYGSSSSQMATDNYGNAANDYGNSVNSAGNDYGAMNAYGQPQTSCRRSQDVKCYKTPRTVTVQQCQKKADRHCERFSINIPSVEARQSCRNEEKRVCDLEERTTAKQIKRYTYSTQCVAVPRMVCEYADQKTLVPSCVAVTRKTCSYTPVEQCNETPKEFCTKVNDRIQKQRCETVTLKANSYENNYENNAEY